MRKILIYFAGTVSFVLTSIVFLISLPFNTILDFILKTQRCHLSALLLISIVKGDKNQVESQNGKELFQTILGQLFAQILNIIGLIHSIAFYYGACVIACRKLRGAFCLGPYIIGGEPLQPYYTNYLFQHEYGHYLQSKSAGPLYLFQYAIPSVLDYWLKLYPRHADHPAEKDANARAYRFWKENVSDFNSNGKDWKQ